LILEHSELYKNQSCEKLNDRN
ncbi:hypothetical protein LCGC14_1626940, partial [marine sediment metagenome]